MTLICPVLNLISMFQNVLQNHSILRAFWISWYLWVQRPSRRLNVKKKRKKTVRVFIKYLITLGYLLRTKCLRAYNL